MSGEALQLLHDIKRTKALSVDETGWIYWNISDIRAVQRKSKEVYENHVEFVKWGKQALFPHKLHWIVSDGTQALTLALGEYFDEWWSWYLFSCEHSSRNEGNRGIRFESHRAAVGPLLHLKKFSEIEVPLRHMLEVIEEDKNWESGVFAEFTYYTLLAEKAFNLNQTELFKEAVMNLKILIGRVKELTHTVADEKNRSMLGSWESFNYSRLTKDSMSVLFHNVACTFHRIGRYEDSAETFQLALQNGVNITTYGLALFLSSLWKRNKNNIEVSEAFAKYSPKGLTVSELIKFDSDLTEIEWQLPSEED